MFFLLNVINIDAQNMSRLYETILIDEFRADTNSINDTLFYSLGIKDCESDFLQVYDINIKNPFIVNSIPNVYRDKPYASFIALRAPELDKTYIYITVTYYEVRYVEGEDYTSMTNVGSSFYYFKYNITEKKYIFFKKKYIH